MTDRTNDDELADVGDAPASDDPTGVEQIEQGEPLIPTDSPVAVQSFGITAEEQRRGPSLDRRLDEEEADVGERPRDTGPEEDQDADAEDVAMHVVEGADRLPGAVDDPVDHYVEDAVEEEEAP